MLSDEEHYLTATQESEGKDRNEALWAKSIALCEGDEDKAKYKYIHLRVEQLKNRPPSQSKPKTPDPIFTKKVLDHFSVKYMPIAEFAKIKRMPEKKIMEMIRDGFYIGQIKDGNWFVNRQEVSKEDISSYGKQPVKPKQAEEEFIPAEKFAEYKNITPEKTIQMIRDGLYVGRLIDDKWYISFSEISGSSEKSFESSELTKWTKWLLYAQVVISVVAIISGIMEYELLSSFKNGDFTSGAYAVAAAESNDSRQRAIGIFQFFVFIISGIIILKWIHRANYNARNLGAANMKFTPGWSIGWYFIPIANLWKPYQAMKEIWKASKNPHNWQSESVPSLLPWWWFFWIVSNLIANASFRLTMRAEEISELISANIATLFLDLAGIPMSLILIAIVTQIYNYHQSHRTESI